MENNTQKNRIDMIQKNVLDKIQAGEIRMRPKFYFTCKVFLLACVSIIVLAISALLVSYILFLIHASGELFLLGFGWRGIAIFFLAFPWFLLAIDLLLILLLDSLIKKFRFGYQRPYVVIAGSTFVIVIIFGTLIYLSPFHGMLIDRAQRKQLPLFGGLYAHIRRPPREQGVSKGLVLSVDKNTFVMHDDDGDPDDATRTVFVPPTIQINNFIHVGDRVIVAGTLSGSDIHAYGIQKIGSSDY